MRQLPAWLHEPRENLVDAAQRQRDAAAETFRTRRRPLNADRLAELRNLMAGLLLRPETNEAGKRANASGL